MSDKGLWQLIRGGWATLEIGQAKNFWRFFGETKIGKVVFFGGENVASKSEQRDVALVAANHGGLAHPGNWPGKKNLRSWNNFFGKV